MLMSQYSFAGRPEGVLSSARIGVSVMFTRRVPPACGRDLSSKVAGSGVSVRREGVTS